ncbi:MAG: AAA family ATPase [Bacteroidota bacterium]
MLIIGITGTLGAGKGTIVDYLVQEKGFVHFSVRGYITEEIIRQELPVNRDSMVTVANKLRADHSPSYIIDRLYDQALLTGKNCIIESIRTPGEVQSLREKGNFVLFAVDADPVLRYDRIVMRNSETDRISYKIFIENEEQPSDEPEELDLAGRQRPVGGEHEKDEVGPRDEALRDRSLAGDDGVGARGVDDGDGPQERGRASWLASTSSRS